MHRCRTALVLLVATVVATAGLTLVGGSPAGAVPPLCTVRQLTSGASDDDVNVEAGKAIDAAGDTVAFASNADYLGTNADDSIARFSRAP